MGTRQYARPSDSRPPVPTHSEWDKMATHAWPTTTRPLSDIRELTEPSLLDVLARKPIADSHRQRGVKRQTSMKRGLSLKRGGSVRLVEPNGNSGHTCETEDSNLTSNSPASVRDTSSMYSIPFSSIPVRASSQTRDATRTIRSIGLRPSVGTTTIPNRGRSQSPVKQAGAQLDPISSQSSRPIPSRTFVRTPYPKDILEFPVHRHPRIGLDTQLVAPLFAGGGSVEGCVRVVVDDAERIRQKKNLTIGRLAVDLVGVEETSGNRKSIFLSLGTELLDPDHPPPRNMLDPANPHQGVDSFWTLMPSFSSLPFMISLPLDTGPPPFHSKHARIRFILCATLLLKDSGRQYLVRCSQDIAVLSTYDPEKALRSLPSPLTASDEITSTKSGIVESTKATAGLHRQVWVSGSTIFVDIHIANNSRKSIKKLELSLERDILCYRHAAAATLEQSASQARIFESNDRSILSKSCLKQGAQGWAGIEAYGSVTRTCDLDIPRGHATVKCGKYFEVRYFLNLCVSSSHTKLIAVQLPIILIHMNSLDVVPNSVAQVAAAIEEKRSHHHRGRSRSASDPTTKKQSRLRSTPSPAKQGANLRRRPSQIQGRAFAAPRQQSLERTHAEAADLHQLSTLIDSSPRKYAAGQRKDKHTGASSSNIHTVGRNRKATIVSRPAREVHKQPSNLSLGGISVGSYTIFNDSSSSGAGMEYVTPPSKRKGRIFDLSAMSGLDVEDNLQEGGGREGKNRMNRMRTARSVDSAVSRKSSMAGKGRWRDHFHISRKDNAPSAPVGRNASVGRRDQPGVMAAYAIGLTDHVSTTQQPRPLQTQPAIGRPSREGVTRLERASSWRAKDDRSNNWLDKNKFELTAVKKRPSGGFKDWLGGLKGSKHDTSRRGNWL